MTERFDVYAACARCGAEIPDWRARLLPVVEGRLVLSPRRELALRVEADEACPRCGSTDAEIRVESGDA